MGFFGKSSRVTRCLVALEHVFRTPAFRLRSGCVLGLAQLEKGPMLWRIFYILGSPFEAVGADYKVSRRDGCISTGRVRPRSAPRGRGTRLGAVFGGWDFLENLLE